jgi:hypothetical protein
MSNEGFPMANQTADQAQDFDLPAHQQMWHTFTRIAMFGAIGIAGLLIFLAIVVL